MLENAIMALQQNTNYPTFTPDDAVAAASSFGAFLMTLFAFLNLGLGLVYTFFGAKFIKYIISLFTGLFVASTLFGVLTYLTGSVSTGGGIAAFVIFGLVSYGCLKLEKTHAALLGFGIGIYIGSIAYLLFLSYFTPL